MHTRGRLDRRCTPRRVYDDVVGEVARELAASMAGAQPTPACRASA